MTTTWTPQIPIGNTINYGMGWFVRNSQGQRLIEHGGAIAAGRTPNTQGIGSCRSACSPIRNWRVSG